MAHNPTILYTENLTVAFGGVQALNGVSIAVREREILSVIGPNGAGKTSLFNTITGTYLPARGRVLFRESDITGRKPHEIARLGIARSFQNLKPFAEMTVLENVLIGLERSFSYGLLATVLRTGKFHTEEQERRHTAEELLEFVGLERRRRSLARNLTYGEQKMLEIARALAVEPAVLLLDEPVAGMNPTETGFVMDLVRKVRERGITVVIIEHDMKMVMGISDRICVLDRGELIAEGSPDTIRQDRRVIEAYLGGGKHAQA
jgi:branched-chain amino acid transport system ATP-binding protein